MAQLNAILTYSSPAIAAIAPTKHARGIIYSSHFSSSIYDLFLCANISSCRLLLLRWWSLIQKQLTFWELWLNQFCYLHPPNCCLLCFMFVEHLLHHRFCQAKPLSFKEVPLKIYKHACMDVLRSIVWILVFFFLVICMCLLWMFYFSDGSFFCMFWHFILLHSWVQEEVLVLQVNLKVRLFG